MFRSIFRLLVIAPALAAHALVPAFPGAEGAGRYATGGRGGKVIAVTNLDDSGPGSFRAAVMEKGPRIVVFRVAGTIPLQSALRIGHGDITIAGQSAPGGGICLKNFGIDLSGSRNVIIRHLRIRPGDGKQKELDAITGSNCANVIIDHCSASWSVDETVSIYKSRRITVQWCIISESLYNSAHHKGEHGYGGIWGGTEASWHHNLIAHHTSRNPRFARGERSLEFRNNFVYNWGYNSLYGGENSEVNIVSNFFRPGPATEDACATRILDASGKKSRWYLWGNVMDGAPDVSRNNWDGVFKPWTDDDRKIRASKRFPVDPIRTMTASEAAEAVLKFAGATLPVRDSVDRRVVAEAASGRAEYGTSYRGGGNGIIDSPDDVGGWPNLRPATAPSDSDGDGMADSWERKWGFNPEDPGDGRRDFDNDGYSNVEEFLNDSAPDKIERPAYDGR